MVKASFLGAILTLALGARNVAAAAAPGEEYGEGYAIVAPPFANDDLAPRTWWLFGDWLKTDKTKSWPWDVYGELAKWKRTGCVCYGWAYGDNGRSPRTVLKTTDRGWCWREGQLNGWHRAEIDRAIRNCIVTPYVDGPYGKEVCQKGGKTGIDECVEFLNANIVHMTATHDYGFNPMSPIGFNPTSCRAPTECKAGWVKCGNVCIDPSCQTCASGIPVPKKNKREAAPGDVETVFPACPENHEVCPLDRGQGYECLDTTSHLESCGGCPGTPGSVDCSAIPGVNSVACVQGQCQVYTCLEGFAAVDGTCTKA